MKIDLEKPSTLILENCWPTAIRSQFVGQPIYSLGDYQSISITNIPSRRYVRATLTINDGYMLTEYDLEIENIKDLAKEKIEKPVKRTGRRITID